MFTSLFRQCLLFIFGVNKIENFHGVEEEIKTAQFGRLSLLPFFCLNQPTHQIQLETPDVAHCYYDKNDRS